MRLFLSATFLCAVVCCRAQFADSLIQHSNSLLKNISTGDSLTYYQCHVEEVGMQLTTASGQTITSNPHKCSITEKYVVIKNSDSYLLRYYTSSYTDLPNRRFTGLKMREKPYWNFRKDKEVTLTEMDLKVLLALERKGKEAIEYDFVVSKNNTNQLIIKHKKDFKQLVIDGGYVISKLVVNKS